MIITANGDYPIATQDNSVSGAGSIRAGGSAGSALSVLTSGVFSTAAAVVGYKNDFGDFVAFVDGTLVTDTQLKLDHGAGVLPIVRVSGADGSTAISINAGYAI